MILVVAEQKNGKLNRATLETLVATKQLSGDMPVKVLVLGGSVGDVPSEFMASQVQEVLIVEDKLLDPYTSEAFVAVLQEIIETEKPSIVALSHTYQTRDFAPMLAARIRSPLITDITALKGTGNSATYMRPMFQGKLVAEVSPQGEKPYLVSFQIGAFRVNETANDSTPAPSRKVNIEINKASISMKPEQPFQEAKQAVDLTQAERIVAVGRGIKSEENLGIVENLAKVVGAQVAASRPICDSGWLPMERQIGSSGQTVGPKLYVALGISGAIQHLVGMKGSRTIVAINKDPDAPIFEVADYGIVGDLFDIVPALVTELEKD